ncbi:PilX N-terminal domain-containing pilus assembly protein [uncultured Comamonas sp.]|uniref:pilus assembly PilX family protein n=1 Tax=uncultured Comamonas sp. TaxID=114710 RepID=UPI0025F7AF6B|nr:PilX N-terminal domain-containing pilus assembly protein [uncultured Comamonas sp.]
MNAFKLPRQKKQRGISLFIVIIFVMLSMLLALWASRTSLFNELIVGNDADYQRAFEAAQAILQDAELDIRGENADGSFCIPSSSDGNICRRTTPEKIPLEAQEVGILLADLADSNKIPDTSPKCKNGICIKRSDRPAIKDKQDFWNNSDSTKGITLAQMTGVHADNTTPVGARYGQFTGAAIGDDDNPASAILRDRSAANQGAWYWIEILPYDESSKNSGVLVNDTSTGTGTNAINPKKILALNLTPNIVYRITAIAYGRKPNTMVVLQQTYARQKLKD